jgi:hypothetical protein
MTNTERWRRWYAKHHPTKSNDKPETIGTAAALIRSAVLKIKIDCPVTDTDTLRSIEAVLALSDPDLEEKFRYFVDDLLENIPPLAPALPWKNFGGSLMWRAETNSASYSAFRPDANADFFEASFSPWSKSGRRLKWRSLGRLPTLAKAKAACEQHAASQKPPRAPQPAKVAT